MNPKISAEHLKRRAIVYIRQSSPGQVMHNQESQRRQYGLADQARQLGFQQGEIIDEIEQDVGFAVQHLISAGGAVSRSWLPAYRATYRIDGISIVSSHKSSRRKASWILCSRLPVSRSTFHPLGVCHGQWAKCGSVTSCLEVFRAGVHLREQQHSDNWSTPVPPRSSV